MRHVEVDSQFAGNSGIKGGDIGSGTYSAVKGVAAEREIVVVPLGALKLGETPRLAGVDEAHVALLADVETPLPPVLVDRRSMRVIDGLHRVQAASRRGQETIRVEFFDGSPADAFLRAVEANVRHGLPLSREDRRAAAARIIVSHPQMSDRAIGRSVGVDGRVVAEIRRCSTDAGPQPSRRVGRDGRVRPLNGEQGRLQAAAILAERPGASLRDVARDAGVSPTTVGDVRRRLQRGEEPLPSAVGAADEQAGQGAIRRSARKRPTPLVPDAVLEKLLRDPSLRQRENGRRLLQLLRLNAIEAQELPEVIAAVPLHRAPIIAQLAHQYAGMWLGFARELERRAQGCRPAG